MIVEFNINGIEQIQQFSASGFPFETTIISESEMYLLS